MVDSHDIDGVCVVVDLIDDAVLTTSSGQRPANSRWSGSPTRLGSSVRPPTRSSTIAAATDSGSRLRLSDRSADAATCNRYPTGSLRQILGPQCVEADHVAGLDFAPCRLDLREGRSIGEQLQCVLQSLEILGLTSTAAGTPLRVNTTRSCSRSTWSTTSERRALISDNESVVDIDQNSSHCRLSPDRV